MVLDGDDVITEKWGNGAEIKREERKGREGGGGRREAERKRGRSR